MRNSVEKLPLKVNVPMQKNTNWLLQKVYMLSQIQIYRFDIHFPATFTGATGRGREEKKKENRRIGSIGTTSSAYRCASISLRTWRQTTFFHRRACIFHSEASREYIRRMTKLKSGIHRFRRTFCKSPGALTESSLHPFPGLVLP